ncbi:hypothetical protein ACIQM3_20765 [Streptomyces sp. NPDC091271]|uniref:hypothetical protein n=1 Tax=Streptomyces sp. NPDC091271 TaxID=3365980 RepID=UPI0038134937
MRSLQFCPPRDHRARWDELWAGYLRFYNELHRKITELTWRRLMDLVDQSHGLVAVVGERAIKLRALPRASDHVVSEREVMSCGIVRQLAANLSRNGGAGISREHSRVS